MTSSLQCISVGDAYISYDFFESKLRVQGPKLGVEKATERVEEAFSATQLDDSIENNRPPGDEARIAPLRRKRDAALISAWEEIILPALPKILKHAIDDEERYTACMVRERSAKGNLVPCIQIESPDLPNDHTKKSIRAEIASLCRERLGDRVPKVNFYKGRVAYLVDQDSSDDEGCDEDDCDEVGLDPHNVVEEAEDSEEEATGRFEPEKRYWPKVGMSGSIGPFGNRGVSATIGGYVVINEILYLLLVNHFIQKGVKRLGLGSGIGMTLTSPSLADIDDCRDLYDEDFKKHYEHFKEVPSLSDGYHRLGDIKDLIKRSGFTDERDRQRYMRFIAAAIGRQLLHKNDEEFSIAKVSFRCSDREDEVFRSSTTPKPGRQGNHKLKMDWALAEVTSKHRIGKNHHRYRPRKDDKSTLDYNNEEKPGIVCEETCALQPNEKVHYVGRNSGLQLCEISPTRYLVSEGENQSCEWFMVPEHRLEEANCVGDSGAWTIESSRNRLVAQLWGYSNGKLLISPIEEVFKDIKERLEVESVELLNEYNWPPQKPLTPIPICEDKDEKLAEKRKRKPDISPEAQLRQLLKETQETAVLPLFRTVDATKLPPKLLAPLDTSLKSTPPPPSPTPSLISSNSLESPSLDRKARTPSPLSGQRSPTTPIYSTSPMMVPEVQIYSAPTILSLTDSKRSQSSSEPEAMMMEEPTELGPESQLKPKPKPQNPKLSVRFVLDDNKEGNSSSSSLSSMRVANFLDKFSKIEMPKPIRPPRKSMTMPLFNEFRQAVARTAPIVAPAQ